MRHIVLSLFPAILVALFAVFVVVIQYNPAPETDDEAADRALQIPLFADDPILGDLRAPVTLVAFEDLGCGGCAEQDQIFTQLLAKHPERLKIVWKPLSVTTIPYSTRQAHEYAYCANEQGLFETFKALAFANRTALDSTTLEILIDEAELDRDVLGTCLASGRPQNALDQNELLAQALNIQTVPTIFLDNTQVSHPTTIAGWETLLQL